MNTDFLILLPIVGPVVGAILLWCIPESMKKVSSAFAILVAAAMVWASWKIFISDNIVFTTTWFISEINFSLKANALSKFILLWTWCFSFLIAMYVSSRMYNEKLREFLTYVLITAGFASGAILADSFIVLLFFWEALLVTLYLFITLGGRDNSIRTAVKGFILVGFCDFCFILGVALYWKITGSFDFPIKPLPVQGLALVSFILMVVGATGKAGALPFHTWIPDAAIDAPVGFMAFLPGALEKLLGIYLLARICLDFFSFTTGSAASIGLMTLGAFTIVVAVSMALIQKDIKRLLSYHAISQVGYMIVGIGTGIPSGIIGGLFHMLNNAIYKSALFLGAGSVEHKTGTTDLKSLGGLYRQMPITGICFLICSAAISGIWPLNGFVSKEMVIHGTLESGYKIFAIACWIGAILTFASFLKASHSMFFGEKKEDFKDVKESGILILLPMMILAFLCLFFGLYNKLPLAMIDSTVFFSGRYQDFSKHALDLLNTASGITVACLIFAFLLHRYGWLKAGKKAYLASEIVHNLVIIRDIYRLAERKIFDVYEQGMKIVNTLSLALYHGFDRSSDWLYERAVVDSGKKAINSMRVVHKGNATQYVAWIFAGAVIVTIFVLIF